MTEKSRFGESEGYFEPSLFFAFDVSSDPWRNLVSFYETRFRYVPAEKVDRQQEREKEGARLPSYWKVNIWQEDGGRVECQKRDVRRDVARTVTKREIVCGSNHNISAKRRDTCFSNRATWLYAFGWRANIFCPKKIGRWETLRTDFFVRERRKLRI